jgi:c-di-GMP-binding flagellar brake protein YcgR
VNDLRGSARAQVPARLLDLSVGGALLHLSLPLELGAIHDFSLNIDGRTVWVQAEVRRCTAAERDPGFLVGVQFVGIDPQDEQILRDYLDKA